VPEIKLTEEQTKKVVKSPLDTVTILDHGGNVMGRFDAEITPEIAKEIKRGNKGQPWFTGEKVQARLRALQEEWDRTGGFDKSYMEEFLKRLDEKDPPHQRIESQAG